MGPLRRLVVIRRSGSDGTHFPLCQDSCLFGRSLDCDIRIQLPVVSQQHCRINIQQSEALLVNYSSTNPTQLNGVPVTEPVRLRHGDIITIIDRSFRFESEDLPGGDNSTDGPGQQQKEESQRQDEDVAGSTRPSPGKKVGGRTQAGGPPLSTEPGLFQRRSPARVLSQMERQNLKTPARKPRMSLGSWEVSTSRAGSLADATAAADPENEEVPFKRRRVSFGGSLRPELFDENLPPNTPLKRGETPGKCKSLGIPAPTVLKKVGREQSSAEKGDPSSSIPPEAKETSTSHGRKSQHSTPRRRSHKGASRRKSVDKNTLQIIYPKRRSSTSRAKLPGGKSWAEIVKLGTKQPQIQKVKQGPQRHQRKRQRRNATPQKLLDHTDNPFSTGHANSPRTIVIGRAHVDRVTAPARPYRMLNNFILNQKVKFTEDFTGLEEMFKTPGKEKPQRTSLCADGIKTSETVFEEKNLGNIPETLGDLDDVPPPIAQLEDLGDFSQNSLEQRLEPGKTLAALKTMPSASAKVEKDVVSTRDRKSTPRSQQKSRDSSVLREIPKTPKHKSKSGATPSVSPCLPGDTRASPGVKESLCGLKDGIPVPQPAEEPEGPTRMSPRLLRGNTSPEVMEDLSRMNDSISTQISPDESVTDEEIHRIIQKASKHTRKSGNTPQILSRMRRNSSISLELGHDWPSTKDPKFTPGSQQKPQSTSVLTPQRTSESGATLRVSLSLLKDTGVSPEVEELSGVTADVQAAQPPEESLTGDEVLRIIQKTSKRTPKSGRTPRRSLSLLRDTSTRPEVLEHLSGESEGGPKPDSVQKSRCDDDHREIPETAQHIPTPGTPRVWRSLNASSELVEHLAGTKEQSTTMESQRKSRNSSVFREIRETQRRASKSGATPCVSPHVPLSLPRNTHARTEVVEDVSGENGGVQTPQHPEESVSDEEVHEMTLTTPQRTPKSGATPRTSLRLLKSNASPQVVEVLSGENDSLPPSPKESVSDEEVHKMTLTTPQHTPKSGATPRTSLRLLRSLRGSPQVVENVSGENDGLPAPRPPEESLSDEEVHKTTLTTPQRTPKSGATPRTSLRLLKSNASPQVVEVLSGENDSLPPSPKESVSDEEVHKMTLTTPQRTPKSGAMPRTSLRLLRSLRGSPQVVEDVSGENDGLPAPRPPEETVRDDEAHHLTATTPQCTPKSGGTPRTSPRLLRSLPKSPEVTDLSRVHDGLPTPQPQEETVSEGVSPRTSPRLLRSLHASPEVTDLSGVHDGLPTPRPLETSVSDDKAHQMALKTPQCTPKSGGTPTMSLRLLRNLHTDPEVTEDLSRVNDAILTPKSPGESVRDSGIKRMIQTTPKHTPKAGRTPRMSLGLLRNLHASPQVVEDMSGKDEGVPTPRPLAETVSDEVHKMTLTTPQHTPKSRGTPRMSLRLLRSLHTSPEVGEDLSEGNVAIVKPESPGESVRDSGIKRMIQTTPKHTPKAGRPPRMSPSLLRDATAGAETMEDLSEVGGGMLISPPEDSVCHEGIHRTTQKTSGRTPQTSLRLQRASSARPEDVGEMSGVTDYMPTPQGSASDEEVLHVTETTNNVTPQTGGTPQMSFRQKTPQHTAKSGGTSRVWGNPNASPELVEDPVSMKDQKSTVGSRRKSRHSSVLREIQETPKHMSELGAAQRVSLNLLRNASASPEIVEVLSEENDGVPTPQHTPKSRGTPRTSPRLLRSLHASPEVVEDVSGENDAVPTPQPPEVSVSDEEVQQPTRKTPQRTPKSGGTPRTSPRLLRSHHTSPEVLEDLSGENDGVSTPESLQKSRSGEVHGEILKTSQHIPKSRRTTRTPQGLQRSLSASPDQLEKLSKTRNDVLTAASVSDDGIQRINEKTLTGTPKRGGTPRMPQRLLRDTSASPEVKEDLCGVNAQVPMPQSSALDSGIEKEVHQMPPSPEQSSWSSGLHTVSNASPVLVEDQRPTAQEPEEEAVRPEAFVRPIAKSLLRSSLKKKPELVESLSLNVLKPPPAAHPEHQTVNKKRKTASRERPGPLTGSKTRAPVGEPTGFKTRVRAPKRSCEWAGNLTGLKRLMESPGGHLVGESTEDAPSIGTTPEQSQASPLPDRCVVGKERPAGNQVRHQLVEMVPTVHEEASGALTENKSGAGDSQENSEDPCEDESQKDSSEKLWPANVAEIGTSQRTRVRNKRGRDLQESEHLPHQTEKGEAETSIQTAEPAPQAPSRRRRRAGTDEQGSQPPPPETPIRTRDGKGTLRNSQRRASTEAAAGAGRVAACRPQGRRGNATQRPEAGSLSCSAEALPTEDAERPVGMEQGKAGSTRVEKAASRGRKPVGMDSELAAGSSKVSPMRTQEPSASSHPVTSEAVIKEERTDPESTDKVCAETAATRGMRSRRGPSSRCSSTPLSTTKTANSGAARRTRQESRQPPKEELKEETSLKPRQQRQRRGKETQRSPSLPAICEEGPADQSSEDSRLGPPAPAPDGTDPEDLVSGASATEVKEIIEEMHTSTPVKTGRLRRGTKSRDPGLGSVRQDGVSNITTNRPAAGPEPSTEQVPAITSRKRGTESKASTEKAPVTTTRTRRANLEPSTEKALVTTTRRQKAEPQSSTETAPVIATRRTRGADPEPSTDPVPVTTSRKQKADPEPNTEQIAVSTRRARGAEPEASNDRELVTTTSKRKADPEPIPVTTRRKADPGPSTVQVPVTTRRARGAEPEAKNDRELVTTNRRQKADPEPSTEQVPVTTRKTQGAEPEASSDKSVTTIRRRKADPEPSTEKVPVSTRRARGAEPEAKNDRELVTTTNKRKVEPEPIPVTTRRRKADPGPSTEQIPVTTRRARGAEPEAKNDRELVTTTRRQKADPEPSTEQVPVSTRRAREAEPEASSDKKSVTTIRRRKADPEPSTEKVPVTTRRAQGAEVEASNDKKSVTTTRRRKADPEPSTEKVPVTTRRTQVADLQPSTDQVLVTTTRKQEADPEPSSGKELVITTRKQRADPESSAEHIPVTTRRARRADTEPSTDQVPVTTTRKRGAGPEPSKDKKLVITTRKKRADPEPNVENTLEQAHDLSKKISEDDISVLGTRSSRLRSRNQTKQEGKLGSKEELTEKSQQNQGSGRPLPRATRGAKRGPAAEPAPGDLEQGEDGRPTKRARTRR